MNELNRFYVDCKLFAENDTSRCFSPWSNLTVVVTLTRIVCTKKTRTSNMTCLLVSLEEVNSYKGLCRIDSAMSKGFYCSAADTKIISFIFPLIPVVLLFLITNITRKIIYFYLWKNNDFQITFSQFLSAIFR